MPTRRSRREKQPAVADRALSAEEFAALMRACLEAGGTWPGAVAVSGGGDSTALMVLLDDWSMAEDRAPPVVLTVDHGLHHNSSDHAATVVEDARAAGLGVHALKWRGRKPASDIEGVAREARYRLMGGWCIEHGIGCLYVAHTLEDQAETFLLRLARGSGVDGLAAMSPVSGFPLAGFEGLRLVRPLLGVPRARLRALLAVRGRSWREDPMNTDPRFARARLRSAWPELERLGLTAPRIAGAARHLSRARIALEADVEALLREGSCRKTNGVLLDGARLAEAPDEIGLRALARMLMLVSGQSFRPRMERLERLMTAIRSGEIGNGRTLHGCCIRTVAGSGIRSGPQSLWITPEPGTRRMVGKTGAGCRGERNSDVKANSKRALPAGRKNS